MFSRERPISAREAESRPIEADNVRARSAAKGLRADVSALKRGSVLTSAIPSPDAIEEVRVAFGY
jgi:hypothetical protein